MTHLYRHKKTHGKYFIMTISWIPAFAGMTKSNWEKISWKRIFPLLLCYSLIISAPLFAAPSKQVLVGPEDTVYSIAYDNGLPTRALITANGLRAPYVLIPGQVLVIPSPGEHIVGAGESLQAVAEEYGVKVDVLAQENRIGSPYFVRPGDVLSIPPHDTESLTEALVSESPEIVTSSLAPLPLVKTAPMQGKSGAVGGAPRASLPDDLAAELAREKGEEPPTKPVLMGNLARGNEGAPTGGELLIEEEPIKEKPKKAAKKEEKKTVKKEEKSVKKEKKEEQVASKKEEVKDIVFIWPVEGKVIAKFSAGKNDGINIDVSEGTAVKASAGGEVMYAGSELKGFGNLLLIKHKDGWTTVYAHLSELLVKKGDKVKQGHLIAKSGKTGDAKVPQLHFEIRMVKKAVDPLSKLES
ncbi:MAG: peptidoglycan DD-metalloendopeptidase family protein [Proteobacteria bacterium]|nr:peptidoglycan DD-metalloendopeptidase family protein [Pseudomonadota bacterium]